MIEENFGQKLDKLRLIFYGGHSFRAICPICGEPVNCDDDITLGDWGFPIDKPNATCKIHGRIMMPYHGTVVAPKN